MNMERNPKRPTAARVSGREMADTLAEVLKDQTQKEINRSGAGKGGVKRRTSPITWLVLILGSVLSGYVWYAPPSWLDPTPPSLPPVLAEAGMKMEVFQQALLVEQFLIERGRLPSDLAEAGALSTGVEYEKLDAERYRLTLSGSIASVEYVSVDSLDGFLGNSLQIIRQGG